jgi:large subunit ribosomal protein L18
MNQGPRYRVKPRRRREGLTDYRKRLALIKSRKVRMVVRKSIKNTLVQFVEYNADGDRIIATANSKELVSNYKWKYSTSTTPAAYLTGLIAGKKAKNKGINEFVLDIGRYASVTGSKVFASLKGAIDVGLDCSYNEEQIPKQDRLEGKHLDEKMSATVEDIKKKIIGDE